MAIYTGVADGNGDFTIPFSTNYTSGQKVTVTAEKDASTKSIELFAPSEVIGEAIKISGSWNNFPANIGIVTMTFSGAIQSSAFWPRSSNAGFSNASGLVLEGVTGIGSYAFAEWTKMTSLVFDNSLLTISSFAFENCSLLEELVITDSITAIGDAAFRYAYALKKLTLGSALSSLGGAAFEYLVECNEIICKRTTPPTILSNTFDSLKSSCVIKVPSASLTAYQTAENWSAHASKMVGV